MFTLGAALHERRWWRCSNPFPEETQHYFTRVDKNSFRQIITIPIEGEWKKYVHYKCNTVDYGRIRTTLEKGTVVIKHPLLECVFPNCLKQCLVGVQTVRQTVLSVQPCAGGEVVFHRAVWYVYVQSGHSDPPHGWLVGIPAVVCNYGSSPASLFSLHRTFSQGGPCLYWCHTPITWPYSSASNYNNNTSMGKICSSSSSSYSMMRG